MISTVIFLVFGLCGTGGASAVERAAGQRSLQTSRSLYEAAPLSPSDLIIVYITTPSRLPLVHATRPARRGIRTVIILQDASEAARLNELYGGEKSEHNETFLAWVDPAAGAGAGVKSGPYGHMPPAVTHPLHLLGPAWAMAPLLAHAAVLASSSTPPLATTAAATAASAAASSAAGGSSPPPPYRWMLIARDDTLWRPHQVIRLLSQYDDGVAAAISDHFIDFNGRKLLAPSPAAAVCLPCSFNLTELLGRRHPPGVPQPSCPVCRPAGGCEFRFNLCGGLTGGPYCGTKRFLGSGDRCSHSWAAGGAGVALSITLLTYLDQEEWAGCVRAQRPSTGERCLGRCLWRNGFSFTHPAAGLSDGLTRNVFSTQHMLFGNPFVRQEIFGSNADAVLGPAYNADEEAVKAAAAAATGVELVPGTELRDGAAAGIAMPTSTRLPPAGEHDCDADCRQWLLRRGVNVHLDVPYTDGIDITSAATVLQTAAENVARASD
ncbi:hypothetical protein Vretimale_16496 [Volvox reticuliferus]|uniref:Uncharacterized protein n=1 Tax=Volvox reticuliferus TaxID=1737510 RepID=A0A8J4CZW0_9CHLO|nr:hypothetical protein Vretifemale_17578 [Volvox reticuliferus]GIM13441.1 hypothetical protein Vretimale_16496 [Volvox reticuliferus]